jgi:hypothetical protein
MVLFSRSFIRKRVLWLATTRPRVWSPMVQLAHPSSRHFASAPNAGGVQG